MRWLPLCLLLAACSSVSTPSVASVASSTTEGLTIPADSNGVETTVSTGITSETGASAAGPAVTVPSTITETSTAGAGVVVPQGFATTSARVTSADGTVCEICVWLASTPADRARGLMGVTDLGAADAMAFLYPDPHTGSFWMKNTVTPLSIAFYSPSGSYLDAFDMEPCTAEQCPSYPTPADFLIAVEVPQGELASLGITRGSTLELLDLPCSDT